MKKWVCKTLLLIPILSTSLLPCSFINSCSKSGSIAKIDGSNWQGIRAGKFFEEDYDIDWQQKTVTYHHSLGIHSKNLVMPNYVKSNGVVLKVLLGPKCFAGNNGIVDSIELNDFMNYIPDQCFYNSYSLKTVIFHSQPISIGNNAFSDCPLEKIYIKSNGQLFENWSASLRYVGDFAFLHCFLSGTLTFGGLISYLGHYAFSGNFIDVVNLKFANELTAISKGCFASCDNLRKVYLPNTITKIDASAFQLCRQLTTIDLPSDKMNIDVGDWAFFNCEEFISFTKPVKFSNIGKSAFVGTTRMNFCPWNTQYGSCIINDSAFAECNFSVLSFDSNIVDVKDYAFSFNDNLSIIDFSTCEPDYKFYEWTGKHIFESRPGVEQSGTVYVSSAQSLKPELKEFLDRNGIYTGRGDPTDWTVKTVDDIPKKITYPSQRIYEMVTTEGSGSVSIDGFKCDPSYRSTPQLEAFAISYPIHSLGATFEIKVENWNPDEKTFSVRIEVSNLSKPLSYTAPLQLFYRQIPLICFEEGNPEPIPPPDISLHIT